MQNGRQFTRTILGFLLLLFVFVNVVAVGVFGAPRVARAQFVVTDPPLLAAVVTKEVKSSIFDALWDVLVGTITAGVIFIAQRVAYETAIGLADRGTGKTPLFQSVDFGGYLKSTAEDAMMQALDSLAGDWLGLDICKPLDIRARLSINLGLRQLTVPKARCTWEQVGAAWDTQWETLKKQYGGCSPGGQNANKNYNKQGSNSTEDCMLALARDVFKPSNTELGASVEAGFAVQDFVRKKELASTKDREEGKGFTPVKSLISQHIETPAANVAREAEGLSGPEVRGPGFSLFSGVLGSGAKGALSGILGIFANTFLSRLGSNAMDGLFKEKTSQGSAGGGGGGLYEPGAGSTIGVSPQVTALLTQTISVRDAGLYDILSQFVACPSEDGDINRRPDECVIDTDFEQAVRSAESGDPLTIKQAMEKNLLHANWRLVSPLDVGLNTDADCRNQAYCHSNIAKLRLARIVPLGFEIAAALSPRESSWTLGEVVAGFNDCANGVRDDTHPFCHLIDPNWILKAPLTRCKAEVPGPMLATQDSNIRHSICVDKPTCLQDDGKGSCESPWGYCVREKNIWRFDADTCPAQFATCTTYNGASPGAQKNVSYLSRTVDFGVCTEQDVGCRQYAVAQSWNPDVQGNYDWNLQFGARYFNGKATTCTQPGCNQFIRQDGSSVYLKKAPRYLKCYDSNIVNVDDRIIDWPEKLADLAKLQPRTECKDYAPTCAKDEVGCTRYTPDNDDPAIPAIASAGDKCANECVGYSTYKQMPVTFERAKFPLYFIPETAQQCSGAELGCDQFVNVEAGEKLEYYSFVRQCEKPAPDNTNSVVFYAWEGSDAQGYQLRSYVLKKSAGKVYPDDDPTDITPAYAAAYDVARMNAYHEICNKDLYTERIADPDCRELFDRDGNAYYRLLSKTITVSDKCAVVRKTDPDIYYASRDVIREAACTDAKGIWSANQGCQICEGGGENRSGVCFYTTLASEAVACPAQAAGCRAYTGNAGNNVRVRYQAKFDDLDTTGWSGGTLSAESVVVGGKSLRVDGGAHGGNVSLSISSTPAAGSSYLMNFWAKGQGTLTVTFDKTQAEPSNTNTFRLTGDWRQFSLGPVYVKSVQDGAAIVFSVDSIVPLFLDNIVIRETIDTVNVVKNSWKTPASCDANPNDAIPGEALGCQLYRDHNDAPVSLKSFTRICRDVAVGCEKLTDTYNTPELEGKTYLMRCSAGLGDTVDLQSSACIPDFDVDGDGQKDNKVVCTLALGNDSCTFTVNRTPGPNDQDNHWVSSVQVSADSIAYLVNRQEFRCDAKEKGCMILGEIKGAGANLTKTSVNKLVDAEKYEQLLCTADVEGCEAYRAGSGDESRTVYFKDQVVTGKPLCEYKENAGGDSGWFTKGTSDECYTNYRVTGNAYGVKSHGDVGYDGRLGLCPEQNNACKEFRDPADTSQVYPEGQPYYVLDNAKIDRASCNNQASLQEGCVLFNDTSDPTAVWNTTSTYKLSAERNGVLVPPVKLTNEERQKDSVVDCSKEPCRLAGDRSFPPKGSYDLLNFNTECESGYNRRTFVHAGQQRRWPVCVPMFPANTILKVTRDRACAEWLACRSAAVTVDKATNQQKIICNDLALCNNFSPQPGQNEQCTNYIVEPEWAEKILTANEYSTRNVDWYGSEYSGYSFYNKYQITDYRFLSSKNNGVILAAVPYSFDDARSLCSEHDESTWCGNENNGVCIGGVCARPFDESDLPVNPGRLLALTNSGAMSGLACRGYAQTDAPFTFKADTQIKWKPTNDLTTYPEEMLVNGFDRASVCQFSQQCMCSYKKVEYGQGEFTRFYDDDTAAPKGICRGGYTEVGAVDKTGNLCATSKKCRDDRFRTNADGIIVPKDGQEAGLEVRDQRDGECLLQNKIALNRGWWGYCLEQDKSIRTPGSGVGNDEQRYACLTWMPLDAVPGAPSIENEVESAGYSIAAGNTKNYCANSVGNASDVRGRCREGRFPEFQFACADQYLENTYSYMGGVHGLVASAGNNVAAARSLTVIPDAATIKLSDVDYILLDLVDGGDSPYGGKIRIENNGTTVDGQGFIGKPRIYDSGGGADNCASTAQRVGLNSQNYECISAIQRDPAGDIIDSYTSGPSGISSVKRGADDKTYFSFVYSDYEGHVFSYSELLANRLLNHRDARWDGDPNDGGWIVYVFNADGSLQNNAQTVAINRNKSESATYIYAMGHIVKREMCKEIVEIADEANNNAALTNRVWENSGYTLKLGPNLQREVEFNQQFTPFGGVSPNATISPNDGPVYQHSSYTTPLGGEMFACEGGLNAGRCGLAEVNNAPWPDAGIEAGILNLSKLFGKAYKSYTLNADRTGYTENSCGGDSQGDGCYDVRSMVGNALPPKIASLNLDDCDVDAGICPLKDVGKFTLNDTDTGILFGNGFKSVSARFFSWADTNRMPIKNIIVDWGIEGAVPAGNSPGKYKNRKPECNNNTTFGDSSGACDKAYYEFFGAYTFNAGNTDNCNYRIGGRSPDGFTDADKAQLTRRGLKQNDRYCAYKPKVIVIDNWGWCNGICQTNRVPDGDHDVTHIGCWGSDDPDDPNKCTDSNHADYSKAGTPFAGWVIVAEQK